MLDKLKNQLTRLGYYVTHYYDPESIGVARRTPTDSDVPGLKVVSFDCIVEVRDGVRIEYNLANISDEVVFKSTSRAANWIKTKFPI